MFGDVDGDGELDMAFATMDGRVYLADAATGSVKDGWPFRTFWRDHRARTHRQS